MLDIDVRERVRACIRLCGLFVHTKTLKHRIILQYRLQSDFHCHKTNKGHAHSGSSNRQEREEGVCVCERERDCVCERERAHLHATLRTHSWLQ